MYVFTCGIVYALSRCHGNRHLEAEGMERTYKFKQQELKSHVDLQTQRKIFDLDLDKFGPYRLNYDRNGRYACVLSCVLGEGGVRHDAYIHVG